MTWEPVAAVGFVAFFGGLLLVSRVMSWIAGLVLLFKSPATESAEKVGFSLAQIFLHSGPWSLAVAIGAVYYVATLPERVWLWAVLGGLGLAILLLGITLFVAHVRQRRGAIAPTPLTPERLLKIRRRFFWGTTAYFGGVMAAWMLYSLGPQVRQDLGLALFIVAVCFASGYGCSWFMWQFYGATLQSREDARQLHRQRARLAANVRAHKMTAARKVVLVSESGYLRQHDDLLRDLINRPIHYICVVGKESQHFRNAIDRVSSEIFPTDSHLVVARHPYQTEAEAVADAKRLFDYLGEDVEVVRV